MRGGNVITVRAGVLALTWLSSRAVLVLLLLGPQSWVGGDVSYFDASLGAVGDAGLAGTLVEYPLPAVGVVAVPWLLASGSGAPYAVLLLLAAATTDLAFAVLVARSTDRWWRWGWCATASPAGSW